MDTADRLADVTLTMQALGSPLVKAATDDAGDRAIAALLLSGMGGVGGGLAGYFSGTDKRKRNALIGALLGAGAGASAPYIYKGMSPAAPSLPPERPIAAEERRTLPARLRSLNQPPLERFAKRYAPEIAATVTAPAAYASGLGRRAGEATRDIYASAIRSQALETARRGADKTMRNVLERIGATTTQGPATTASKLGFESLDDFLKYFSAPASGSKTRPVLTLLESLAKKTPRSKPTKLGTGLTPKAELKAWLEEFANVAKTTRMSRNVGRLGSATSAIPVAAAAASLAEWMVPRIESGVGEELFRQGQ